MKLQFELALRLKRIWLYFKPGQLAWITAIGATIVIAATEPLIPALLKPLLDQGFKQGEFSIWVVPLSLILLFGLRGTLSFVAQYGLASFTNRGLLNLRRAMFQKILTSKLSFFSSQSASSLTNTVVYEVYNGASMLALTLMSLLRDSFTLLALITYLFISNWKLTLIVVCVFPAVALVMRALSTRLYKLTKDSQVATDKLAYVVEENVLAQRDIRLHAAQTEQAERFKLLSESLKRLSIKSSAASSAMTPITQMLAAVALSVVISIALFQSGGSGYSVGSFVAFITAMLMLVAPIKHLSEVASPLTRGLAALERGLCLIEDTESEEDGSFSKSRAWGEIRFVNTTVLFNSKTAPALDQFSLIINPGETVALVGASGAGKTTLVSLLPRFLEPSSGSVELDGHDLKEWQLRSLRDQFALVSQHVVMLNDSIAANVALGQEIDRVKLTRCLSAANLDRMISELPNGIDTEVGHNGMKLSGGQRQRLAIARALYKDAPILLLDEATSSLDSESERAVQDSLEILMKNRTTLVIAHRLSTVHRADRIVVMDAGKIVQTGTHSELIQTEGHYARLYRLGLNES